MERFLGNRVSRRRLLTSLGGVVSPVLAGCGTSVTITIGGPTARPEASQAAPDTPKTATPFPVLTAYPATPIQEILATPGNIIEVRSDKNTFEFGEDVPEDQRHQIQDAVTKGTNWFSENGINLENISVFAFTNEQTTVDYYLQRTPQIPQSEHARLRNDAPKLTALTGFNDDFYIITTSSGWKDTPPIIGDLNAIIQGRYHTVIVELFHVWQAKIGLGTMVPRIPWIDVGSAHYLAASFLRETNMYSYEEIRRRHIPVAKNVTQTLFSLESWKEFRNAGDPNTADEYSLAFLAVEYLVRDLPNFGINAVFDYWKKISEGQPHPVAFKAVFGKTPAEFYDKFEPYRRIDFANTSST